MLLVKHRQVRLALYSAACLLLALSAARQSRAQSSDVNFPTPVFSTEVTARIAARDIGDARRTRHFYTFRGTEGDVTVTVEASELIGDVDVFTAATLRPLVKFTLFGDPARVTKSFYVRSEETLVLRVEARANGDSEGTYRVTFGGSFAPAPAGLANVEEPKTPTLSESTRSPSTTTRSPSSLARASSPRFRRRSPIWRPSSVPRRCNSASSRRRSAAARARSACSRSCSVDM